MKTLSNYQKVFLGTNDGQSIYLYPPSWDCNWYWGFGYIGNNNCHYHIDGLKNIEKYNFDSKSWTHESVNMYDGFKRHFGESFLVKRDKDIWTLAELFETFYTLKETAELLGRGGSHMTTNPCKDIIINTNEVKRINETVLPAIFDEIYKILERNADSDRVFKKLVSMNVQGDTQKVVAYMLENEIHTDDLKNIKELTSHDISNIHTFYWKQFHANKTK